MKHGGNGVTRAQYESNLQQKLSDPQFTADISPLLATGRSWDITEAAETVTVALIQRLSGEL